MARSFRLAHLTSPADRRVRRVFAVLTLAAWCYPVVVLSAPYTVWFVAGLTSGHPAQPSVDDPKSISALVDWAYKGAMLVLVSLPSAAIGGVIVVVVNGVLRRLHVVLILVQCVALATCWMAVVLSFRWDPFRVIDWFFD